MSDYPSTERRSPADSRSSRRTPPPRAQAPLPRANEIAADPGLRSLRAAAMSRDPSACSAALGALLMRGIAPETIVDEMIPDLARDMGEAWCEDEMSFADVTIGVARLQSIVRELGTRWGSDMFGAADAPALLLAVPHDVYHTLGAVVLAGQLRRRGYSVRLVLGATGEEIARQMAQARYDAVLISSSRGTSLDSLRVLVDSVRQSAVPAPRIVIGGTILESREDVCALTGADHVSNDPDEALRLCDLSMPPPAAILTAQER